MTIVLLQKMIFNTLTIQAAFFSTMVEATAGATFQKIHKAESVARSFLPASLGDNVEVDKKGMMESLYPEPIPTKATLTSKTEAATPKTKAANPKRVFNSQLRHGTKVEKLLDFGVFPADTHGEDIGVDADDEQDSYGQANGDWQDNYGRADDWQDIYVQYNAAWRHETDDENLLDFDIFPADTHGEDTSFDADDGQDSYGRALQVSCGSGEVEITVYARLDGQDSYLSFKFNIDSYAGELDYYDYYVKLGIAEGEEHSTGFYETNSGGGFFNSLSYLEVWREDDSESTVTLLKLSGSNLEGNFCVELHGCPSNSPSVSAGPSTSLDPSSYPSLSLNPSSSSAPSAGPSASLEPSPVPSLEPSPQPSTAPSPVPSCEPRYVKSNKSEKITKRV